MRTVIGVSPFLLAVSFGAGALAQQPAAPEPAPAPQSVAEYLCLFAGRCGDEQAPDVTRDGPETRGGMRLLRRSPEPIAAAGVVVPTPIVEHGGSSAAPVRRSHPVVRRSHMAVQCRSSASSAATAVRGNLSLTFESGSAMLTEAGRHAAETFAQALADPALAAARFRIEGHTDSVGGRGYNLELSRRRAEAVAAFLDSQGVPRNRFETAGYGFDCPLAGLSGRAGENRRVEAILVSGG